MNYVFVKNLRIGGNTMLYAVKHAKPQNMIMNRFHISFNDLYRAVEGFNLYGKEYQYVTVVRNPFTRLVSWYLLLQKQNRFKDSFEEHLRNPLCYETHNQIKFIQGDDTKVDYIVRFEEENHLQKVWEICEQPPTKYLNRHRNTSKYNKPWQEYYTSEALDLIQNIYKQEFDILGYSNKLEHH